MTRILKALEPASEHMLTGYPAAIAAHNATADAEDSKTTTIDGQTMSFVTND